MARKTLEERFKAKVDMGPHPNGCQLWTGTVSNGYGQICVNGKMVRAHRVAYELHYGPIPEGKEIGHTCDVKICVNYEHLEAVTHSQNQRDKVARGLNRHKPKFLTDDDARAIVELVRFGLTQIEVAADYGVSPEHVNMICRGKRHQHALAASA